MRGEGKKRRQCKHTIQTAQSDDKQSELGHGVVKVGYNSVKRMKGGALALKI